MELSCLACDELKALDIKALDVRGYTSIADYFVLCSGTSDTHIKSIAENIQDKMRQEVNLRTKPQGDSESLWIVLDYGDIIVHIFDEETRGFYDLERLWAEAKPVDWTEFVSPKNDGEQKEETT